LLRRTAYAALLLWLLAPAAAVGAPSGDPVESVTARIICDCGCSNLTVKNCTCGKADRVRAEVTARLSSGQTPEQVLQAYVDEYGEQILAAPTAKGFNLVGWIAPFAAILLGGALLAFVLRRWARVPWQEAPLVPPLVVDGSNPSPGPSFLKRVQEEVDEVER